MRPLRGEGAWEIIVGVAFWSLVVWGTYSLFSDDSSGGSVSGDHYGVYEDSYVNENYAPEPENPYDDGTGHSAGYEWAEENDVSDCDGNSNSFIEGCQEYVDQRDSYEEQESTDY
ncbi:MAG: hypothetical protein AAB472_00245 [Patescibacteria group bacterium]